MFNLKGEKVKTQRFNQTFEDSGIRLAKIGMTFKSQFGHPIKIERYRKLIFHCHLEEAKRLRDLWL